MAIRTGRIQPMAAASRTFHLWYRQHSGLGTHHRLREGYSKSGADGDSQLDLHEIDVDLFIAWSRNMWVPPGGRGVFGGQVVGQALRAAELTVTPERVCHSFHSYFILRGDPTRDIVYRVERVSDRRSFATRAVDAVQNGQIIFKALVSFNSDAMGGGSTRRFGEPQPFAHGPPMPDVPPPESLASHVELISELLPKLPRGARNILGRLLTMPVELRPVDPPNLLDPSPPRKPAHQHVWVRTTQPLGGERSAHHACAAYMSDHQLLATALLPHGVNFPSPRMGRVASLDHTMWFHSDSFRADEWLLYSMASPWSGHGRGLAFGYLYDRQTSQLVVTCAQEGIIRRARPSMRSWLAQASLWSNFHTHRLLSRYR